MNVMLDEAGFRTAVDAQPAVCEEFWRGKRLRGAAHVDLALADEQLIREPLADAWEQKAPKRLLEDRIADAAAARSPLVARCLALARRFRLGEDDLHAWEQSGLPEDAFDDWLTDRVARRPAGRRARDTYGADDRDWAVPDYHSYLQAALKRKPATIDNALPAVDDLYTRRGLGRPRRRGSRSPPPLPARSANACTTCEQSRLSPRPATRPSRWSRCTPAPGSPRPSRSTSPTCAQR